MFLDYLALVILLMGLVAVFYTFIYIHDIPYEAAKHRNHPQAEAIHIAGWLSLFTLHAIWPIIFIWAVSKQGPIDVAVANEAKSNPELDKRLKELESKLRYVEQQMDKQAKKAGKP